MAFVELRLLPAWQSVVHEEVVGLTIKKEAASAASALPRGIIGGDIPLGKYWKAAITSRAKFSSLPQGYFFNLESIFSISAREASCGGVRGELVCSSFQMVRA